jgi:hypothetical protein
MYIEYSRKESDYPRNYWRPFGGSINTHRDYELFGILARGVRGDNPDGFTQKGLLEYDKLGWRSQQDAYKYIDDEYDGDDGQYCTMEEALKYVEYGCVLVNDHNGEPTWVSNIDCHSHSWLSLIDFETALDIYHDYIANLDYVISIEYKAILAAMKELEDNGKNMVRVVFWFDN